MEKNCPSSSCRTDRKTIEKNRRNLMKELYSKLNSLVPHQSSKEATSLPDQLDDAANYIKKLQIKLERLREKKERLQMGNEKYGAANNNCNAGCGVMGASMSPQIEIHEIGSALEVVLVTGLDWQFIFEASIRVLHEEGADIVNASFSVVEDTIFHTIHSKIGGESSPGSAGARISERLQRFVNDQAGAF